MMKEDFLRELEYMLQDVDEEEKEEALQYFRDYLEDAGSEEEASVLNELGSPARVAAMIKAGLSGTDQGEFSENGYGDPRYNGPAYPVGERPKRSGRDFEQAFRKERAKRRSEPYEPERERRTHSEERRNTSPWVVVLILILCLMAAPMILGLGGGLLGLLLGLGGVLLGLLVSAGVLTLALLFGGVVAFIAGIIGFFYSPLRGVLGCFAGVAMTGLGLLVLGFSIWFYGTAVPAIVRGITGGIHTIFRGRNKGGEKTI